MCRHRLSCIYTSSLTHSHKSALTFSRSSLKKKNWIIGWTFFLDFFFFPYKFHFYYLSSSIFHLFWTPILTMLFDSQRKSRKEIARRSHSLIYCTRHKFKLHGAIITIVSSFSAVLFHSLITHTIAGQGGGEQWGGRAWRAVRKGGKTCEKIRRPKNPRENRKKSSNQFFLHHISHSLFFLSFSSLFFRSKFFRIVNF